MCYLLLLTLFSDHNVKRVFKAVLLLQTAKDHVTQAQLSTQCFAVDYFRSTGHIDRTRRTGDIN